MTVSTERLRNQVAQRAADQPAQVPAQATIYDLINQQRNEIARALPKHLDADRLARVVVTTLRTNPALLECSPQSLLAALMLSAQLGLEPGPLGHAYFVPFWNNNAEVIDEKGRKVKQRVREVQWILGYKGIIDLARRSGQLKSIEAREVCDKDEFDFSYGLDEHLHHRPYMGGDRGQIVAVYGIAKFKDGGHYLLVLSKADVDAHRARSKAKDDGPWVTDYPAMARKTVIRAMAPFLPLNVETLQAVAADERVHHDAVPDLEALPAPQFELPSAPPAITTGATSGPVDGVPVEDPPADFDPETGEIIPPGAGA